MSKTLPKTVDIGLETATSALERFLQSGDSPNQCIDVICTINRELKTPRLTCSLQDLVLSFLDSKLLFAACDTWFSGDVPPLLSEVILELFFLVTHSIFEEQGQISTSLLYRHNHVLDLVCSFYNKLFRCACQRERPALLEPQNRRIMDLFVSSLGLNEVLVAEFTATHDGFSPLEFFVRNARVCWKALLKCILVSSLASALVGFMPLLKKVTAWGEEEPVDLATSWKCNFICDLLQPTPISAYSLTLFTAFLELVQGWQHLLHLCIYLLERVPQNSLVDTHIADAVNCRLALIGSILGANLFDDRDEMMVWCFVSTVLKNGSFHLITGLFYEPGHPPDPDPESLERLRIAIYEYVGSGDTFVQYFSRALKYMHTASCQGEETPLRLSTRRSLFGFFCSRLQNFHSNSTRTNRLISEALHLLCTFNCKNSSVPPEILYREFAGLVEAIHDGQPSWDENEVPESDTLGSISVKSFSIPDFPELGRVREEAYKINRRLFEWCLAIVYASAKTRELRQIARNRYRK